MGVVSASLNPDVVLAMRDGIVRHADLGVASKWAERLVNEANDRMNEAADQSHEEAMMMVTQLVSRALLARGVLHLAADWWASIPGQPCRDLCLAALQSIVDDLPPELEQESYLPGQEGPRH